MSQRRVVFAAALVASCWCLSTVPPVAAADGPPSPPPSDRAGRLFPVRVQYEYEYLSSVLADGSCRRATDDGSRNPVGHRVVGRLSVANLWSAASDDDKLLRLHLDLSVHRNTYGITVLFHLKKGSNCYDFDLKSPKLQTWSKKSKSDTSRQFIDRKSKIDEFINQPFFVHWKNGHVEGLYASTTKSLTEENLKKGIAALFQFQLTDQHVLEYSTLGKCNVTYSKVNGNTVSKKIDGCISYKTLPEVRHPDKIWQGTLRSKRESILTYNNDALTEVSLNEDHEFFTIFMDKVGASVSSKQYLQLKGTKSIDDIVKANNIKEVISELEKKINIKLQKQDLSTKHEIKDFKNNKSSNKLENVINKYHNSLLDSELGKSTSAFGAVKTLTAILNSDTKSIKKVLMDKKNEDIIIQLYDILGAALTENSHKAAMETLVFTDSEHFDNIERYLWSASIKFNPNIKIIKSLMALTDQKLISEKLIDTIHNTVTAMTSRLVQFNHTESNVLFYDEIFVKTSDRLGKCKQDDDECLLTYIRALANLRHPLSIDLLLSYAQNGNRKISAYAMKTIKTFGPSSWDSRVLKYCNRIFFQLVKEHDSSTRTIALNILLESNPDYDLLKHVIKWLMVSNEGYEVKQYTLELLKEMANQNEKSARLLKTVLVQEKLNHYGCMAQRGLSSSFSRRFLNYNNITGLVKSSQHIYSGVTKRGSVDIVLEHDNVQFDLCSFGVFTTGLGYFTSLYDDSGKKDKSDEANLPATAGLELIVFGVHIRPFIMFSSQGQLMGHVWAGTGSDRTPIIQGIYQMMEHFEYVPLCNGITTQLSLRGMLSLDIAGQIEMSLWNKNAQSTIEKKGGISIEGSLKLDTDVMTEQVDFELITEGLLHMHSEAEFATKIVLCMQIGLEDTNVNTTVNKDIKIHGQTYKSHIVTTWTHAVSGRTFALNQMVNEFCNVIHSQ